MDDILKQLLPSLGAFGPAAFLGWWIIKTQAAQIQAERDRNNQLTDRVITTLQSTGQVLAELKAALKGGS